MKKRNNKNIIAIIPARGGSKGLLRKNIRKLAGKPLIAYTILAAKKTKLVDRVFISTDDKEIEKIAKKYGAEIIPRLKQLASDFVPSSSVLKHGLAYLERKENYKPDIIVYLQPTDIFRPKGIIDEVIKKLLENPKLDSVFVAHPTYKNFWQKSKRKYERILKKENVVRQKKKPIFREDTGLASAVWASLVKKGERIGDKVEIIENPDPLSFIDIHNLFDLWLAEILIQNLKKDGKIKEYEIY